MRSKIDYLLLVSQQVLKDVFSSGKKSIFIRHVYDNWSAFAINIDLVIRCLMY